MKKINTVINTVNNESAEKNKEDLATFKSLPLHVRQHQSNKWLNRYNDSIPTLCSYLNFNLTMYKYLIPSSFTVGQFLHTIRKKLDMKKTEAMYMYTESHILLSTGSLMKVVYDEHKNQDGFLYIIIALENTFG